MRRAVLKAVGRATKTALGFLFLLSMTAAVILFAYRGLKLSSTHLPPAVHLLILLLYVAVLAWLVSWIATEKSRQTNRQRIRHLFGPYGMVVLPAILLMVSAAVFASITWLLWTRGGVELYACGETAAGQTAVTEARLVDFYTWHFFELVPLLRLNEVLVWEEPLCYSQSRVGLLILLFQACVVLPGISAVRGYWTTRHKNDREAR